MRTTRSRELVLVKLAEEELGLLGAKEGPERPGAVTGERQAGEFRRPEGWGEER